MTREGPLAETIEQSTPAERRSLWQSVLPYLEKESLAAFALGISSGFPYAMIGATLTTRLAQDGIDKKSVTAFSLAFLVYNFKFLWAPLVDGLRLPLIGRLGQHGVDVLQDDVGHGFPSRLQAIRCRPLHHAPEPAFQGGLGSLRVRWLRVA